MTFPTVPLHNQRTFASDNNAGVHPDILQALVRANEGHVAAYGGDAYTASAVQAFRRLFGAEVEVFFVFGGTAANVLGLQAMTRSYQAILCAETAHIYMDECGAPEKIIGSQLIPIGTEDGKITVAHIDAHLRRETVGVQHHVQPHVVSIAQSTEMGTVYTAKEVRDIASFVHGQGLLLHMDGARIANATASLGGDIRSFTLDAGVDVISFGGTKNGLLFGEAVVFFNTALAKDFVFVRKQGMQLASKMRFLAAQFEVLLSNNLWLNNASHANKMAQYLATCLQDILQLTPTQPVQANAVFVRLSNTQIERIQERYRCYVWNEKTGEVRWMTSFDTTQEDIDGFVAWVRTCMKEDANPLK